jgi:aerobic carbon-monoxide dehydrogenase medium subunit
MKPAPFEYFAPTSVEETCALLARYGDDAKILAGGQSLVPLLALRLAQPAVLIDINPVRELDYISASDAGLSIGARTRHRTLERSPLVQQQFPLLSAAVEWVGHPQIRNRGTLGGSLVHADPAAELPALALALDATFTVANSSGNRRMLKSDEFFVSFLTTALNTDELLTEVSFPALPAGTGWSFVEVARRHGDFALVGVAATVTLDNMRTCSGARIALFGVGETAVRSRSAEQALIGQKPGEQVIAAAASEVVKDIHPLSDVHATIAYRKYVARNLVEQALTEAVQRAQ